MIHAPHAPYTYRADFKWDARKSLKPPCWTSLKEQKRLSHTAAFDNNLETFRGNSGLGARMLARGLLVDLWMSTASVCLLYWSGVLGGSI